MGKHINSIESRVKSIGQRIKKGREALSISGEELSKRAGLSFGYISSIEDGKRVPSFWALSRISRVLKILSEELLTGYKASPRKLGRAVNIKEIEKSLCAVK